MTRGWQRVALFAVLVVATVAPLSLISSPMALSAGKLAGRTIVVDPGHGGLDPGAMALDRLEKSITLPIALEVGSLLAREGARVEYTRDVDLTVRPETRAALANSLHADAFVAIHVNSAPDPTIDGVTTLYGDTSGYVDGATRPSDSVAQSRQLALDIQRAAVDATGETDRGVQTSNVYVLGHALMPAVLIETGFMTNATEASKLATPDFQRRIAQGIAAGLTAFLTGDSLSPAEAPAATSDTSTARNASRPGVTIPTPDAMTRTRSGTATGTLRTDQATATRAPPAAFVTRDAPSLLVPVIWFGGGALALGLLGAGGLQYQRSSARRRLWMLRRRRRRRRLSSDIDA